MLRTGCHLLRPHEKNKGKLNNFYHFQKSKGAAIRLAPFDFTFNSSPISFGNPDFHILVIYHFLKAHLILLGGHICLKNLGLNS